MMEMIGALIFVSIFMGVMTVHYLIRRRREGSEMESGTGFDGVAPGDGAESRASYLDRWERMARQAGLDWSRQVYFACGGMALALAAMLIAMDNFNTGVVLALVGLIGPHLYVKRALKQRQALFLRQLPPALFMAASVLRAGGTLMQAVDSIAGEMPDPIGREFRRIQQQMRLQVPAHEAMAEAQERVGVREFAAVVVAARITAEVGGNLAHIFDQISRAIVDAQNAQRTISSFTTEGRMSANMITAMPFVVLGLLHLLSPGYFEPLFTTWPGRFVLAGCLGTIMLGWHIIRRMVDIRMF